MQRLKKFMKSWKSNPVRRKVHWVFFGSCFIIGALCIFDTGRYMFEPIPRWSAIPAFITGLVLIAYGLIKTPPKPKDPAARMRICPKCGTPFGDDPDPGPTCPKCEIPLEPLVGFYERHPEMKDNG